MYVLERVEEQAEAKRRRKGADVLAANWVGGDEGGFESDQNALTLLWEGGQAELPLMPKRTLARAVVKLLLERFSNAIGAAEDP